MGADLSYSCVGGNTYVFTLSFYRDCAGISAPASPLLAISSASGCGSSQSISMTQQSVAEASPLCPDQLPNSTCNGGSLQGVEVYTYTATVTLSGACTDWVASFSDCCRNSAITNSNTGSMYVEATINNVAASCNNSPTFSTPPIPYICVNQAFSYNHGTTDIDGDSLVFTLINPKESATLDVSHNVGFSATQPLSSTGAFNFDPTTGQMNFTPDVLQIGVVAVLIQEYRNGILIGTVMRDMEIVVISCTNNSPSPDPITNLRGAVLNGNAFETCIGNTLSFEISCPDLDGIDIVTISNNITTALPGASVSVTHGNPAHIAVSWVVSSINNQAFFINFNDGACPVVGQQTLGFTIKPISISFPAQDTIKCPNETTKQLQALTASNTGTYSWSAINTSSSNPNTLSDPSISNPIATIQTAPATFSVTYTDPVGCTATNTTTIANHTMDLVFTPNTSSINYCVGDPAVPITAALNGDTPIPVLGGYTVSTTPFAPISITSGTNVSLGDDALSGSLPIGFSFNFWGTNYSNFFISSNGFITFNSGSSSGCCSGQNLPSTTAPNNLIAFAWEDLDPGNGGQPNLNVIRYQTVGSAPNRILVMEFFNVDHYSSGNNVTTQVHLIEATNSIEIHTTTQPDPTGTHTMGIEDATGSNAAVVTGRNASTWTASNDGVVFTPNTVGAISNYTYAWDSTNANSNTISGSISPATTISTSANVIARPNITSVYRCTAADGVCVTQRSTLVGCALLPVKCDQFRAVQQKNSIHLQWVTIHEDNNLGFVIERSTDGILFEEIGWVDGLGTTNVSQYYAYIDAQVADGLTYYYRLKQVDHSTDARYICNIATVQMSGAFVNKIHISPNPTQDNAVLNFHAQQNNSVAIKIVDLLGRGLVNMGTYSITQGHNRINIPMNELAAGVYFVQLSIDNKSFSSLKKIIKQ
ncbi:T9SS type A sorting domain-containing protein [Aureispira anguillae]|nr:T9SS type A sorting domain-containing protein [Aureispira anguillae]